MQAQTRPPSELKPDPKPDAQAERQAQRQAEPPAPAPAPAHAVVDCVWDAHAQLGEGPIWSVREQALYWVDILGRRLYRYTPQNSESRDGTNQRPQKRQQPQQRTWVFDQEISAVAERRDQPGLIITLRHGFAFFDPATQALVPLLAPEAHLPANRFNDGKCDAQGRLWAGTLEFNCKQPSGSLYRLTGKPEMQCERMDSGYIVTNGPTWSQDHKTMYHSDSALGLVYAFDFDASSGSLANRRVFLKFSREDGSPDGMTTDAEGKLWIAHWGAAKLTRHDQSGALLESIDLPCSQVSSCTFGGADLRTMYITTAAVGLEQEQLRAQPQAGGLFAVRLPVAGVPANMFEA